MSRRAIRLAMAIAALCGGATQLYAQVPLSVVASPDIYNVQGPVPSHSVQNIGAKACKIIMFEPK